MGGAIRTPYPILHPCHRSSNPQCWAVDGRLMGGEWKTLLERGCGYVEARRQYISCCKCVWVCVWGWSACHRCSVCVHYVRDGGFRVRWEMGWAELWNWRLPVKKCCVETCWGLLSVLTAKKVCSQFVFKSCLWKRWRWKKKHHKKSAEEAENLLNQGT